MSESEDSLRSRADEAAAVEDWRKAAELYSAAIAAGRSLLPSNVSSIQSNQGLSSTLVGNLLTSLLGRGRALLEIGRSRGKLEAQLEVLQAAAADAQAAAVLARKAHDSVKVCAAQLRLDVLRELGGPIQEAEAALEEAKRYEQDLQVSVLRDTNTNAEIRHLAEAMDAVADDGLSPGTFRWPTSMQMPELPVGRPLLSAVTDAGWGPFLRQRGGDELIAFAQRTARLLDGLSFPISLAWVLGKSKAVMWAEQAPDRELHIVVLGATSKAEVRIWNETRYWNELQDLLSEHCTVKLHFVGPEIHQNQCKSENVHSIKPPCARTFFRGHPELQPHNTVCAVFNGGFGNFVSAPSHSALHRDELLWSWLGDLVFLSEEEFFCTFFCANDYADLRGEVAVHSALLASCFALSPRRNPFSMATVYSGEAGQEGSDEWFSGNSFVYATCGFVAEHQNYELKNLSKSSDRQRMIEAVLDKARSSKGTSNSFEVFSTPPPLLKPDLPASEHRKTTPRSTPGYEGISDVNGPKACTGEQCFRMEFALPAVITIADLDLKISDTYVAVSATGGFSLQKKWPQAIDCARAGASFSSKRRVLIVKAPVLD